MRISKVFRIVAKSFYMLLPKVIREQYKESELYFIDLARKVKNRYLGTSGGGLHVLQFVKSIDKLDIQYETLASIKTRKSRLGSVVLFDKTGNYTKLDEIEENVLDIDLYFFKEITVLGNTDALINGHELYHQELLAMKEHHDLKRSDIFSYFDRKDKSIVSISMSKSQDLTNIDILYISLLKEHSQNYYHWTTEIIPRALFSIKELSKKENSQIFENKSIVFLIDENIPKQCLEILKVIVPFKYNLTTIKKGKLYTCNNLVYCSPFWQSLDNTSGNLEQEEFFVDTYGLKLFHEEIFNCLALPKEEPFRKIYLRRKSTQMRSIVNTKQVEDFFINHGFEIVETEKLIFTEQVKLFYESKVVVGASGATFTNILFMQPNTKAIIFYPSHPSINHGIFQPLADVSGVKLIHYKTIPSDEKSIHSNFMVDLSKIQIILKGC
ncbi:glycosyltransferase family 61 protein [Sulfurimonas sp.]|uniref:glycosyltransferase family 61 protein n=1 Tax=Sulfurimonas sp. TaxID=2022749 RepID=UPI00262E53FD|nr:glycosyltransferase family 61 protein [Sulfurimonas sp.]MDD5157875.1 glycosyltransferase family 61 protein [Sulfurimonas sp.]